MSLVYKIKHRIRKWLGWDRKTQILKKHPKFRDYPYMPGFFMETQERYQKYDLGTFAVGSPEILEWSNWDDRATGPTDLKIGKFAQVSEDVRIVLGGHHRIDWVTTYPFNCLSPKFKHIKGHPTTKGDVIIGNDVWIARNVIILSGVTIGDGAIIGTGSVVTKDVPPYHIAVGVPAKIIRPRFSEELIEQLLDLAWWDFPMDVIEAHVELLQSNNIEGFIKSMKVYKKPTEAPKDEQ